MRPTPITPQQEHEDRGEERGLAPYRVAGRQPLGLVEGEPPGGQGLAERHRDHALGPIERASREHGTIGPIQHREQVLPLEAGQGLLEDAAPELRFAEPEDRKDGSQRPPRECGDESDPIGERHVSSALTFPEPRRDLRAQGGEGRALLGGPLRRIENASATTQDVRALEEGRRAEPGLDGLWTTRGEIGIEDGSSQAHEALVLRLEQGGLDLLHAHSGHVAGLLTHVPLGGGFPPAQ